LAQIINYINVQKDENAAKEISRRANERKVWKKFIDGIKTPEPASNSVLDMPGKLQARLMMMMMKTNYPYKVNNTYSLWKYKW
jgi:hypothetical protein